MLARLGFGRHGDSAVLGTRWSAALRSFPAGRSEFPFGPRQCQSVEESATGRRSGLRAAFCRGTARCADRFRRGSAGIARPGDGPRRAQLPRGRGGRGGRERTRDSSPEPAACPDGSAPAPGPSPHSPHRPDRRRRCETPPGSPRTGAHPLSATDAATQLGAQANGIEPAELQESSQAEIGPLLVEGREGRQGETEHPLGIRPGASLGRKAVEELEEVAAQGKTGGVGAQGVEGPDQARVLQTRHAGGAAPIRLNPEMVEEVERSRKPFDATARTLCDRRQPPRLGDQQMNDPVRLSEVDAPKNQGFGVDRRHPGRLARIPLATRAGKPGPGQGVGRREWPSRG